MAREESTYTANSKQVGGNHYKGGIEHWDYVVANDLDYFQGQITKYVSRWKKKNGVEDLEKARHFLDKYIEVEQERLNKRENPVREDNTGQKNPFGHVGEASGE